MEHHPAALAQISERMLEAVRKGYWDAPDEVVRKLVETHQEIAQSRDLLVENKKFAEFVAQKAAGYGLLAAAKPDAQKGEQQETQDTSQTEQQVANAQQVTGLKLEKQDVAQPASDTPMNWGLYALVFGTFSLGGLWEIMRSLVAQRFQVLA